MSEDIVQNDMAEQNTAEMESHTIEETENPADLSEEVIEQDAQEIVESLKQMESGELSDSSVEPKEDDVPFNQHPRWKQMEGKLSQAEARAVENERSAQFWQTFNEYAQAQPEAALGFIKHLEETGRVAQGTYTKAQQELNPAQKVEPTKGSGGSEDIASAVKSVLSSDPVYRQVSDQIRQQEESVEQVFRQFEQSHPDIPETAQANPEIRRRIFLEAQDAIQKGSSLPEALEQGYNWVMNRDKLIEGAKARGEVDGLVNSIQQNAATGSTFGSAGGTGKSTNLTDFEKKYARSFGMTDEEYASYKADPNGAMTKDMNK